MRRLVDAGARVFLDLKFHDIPNTVAQAVEAAVQTGAWMINVHASGGRADDAGGGAGRRATPPRAPAAPAPLLIAVTVLTSMDEATLRDSRRRAAAARAGRALARMAQEAGLDGVVASPQETAAIRAACGPDFAIVTPGIRGASAGRSRTIRRGRWDRRKRCRPARATSSSAGPSSRRRDPRARRGDRRGAEGRVAEGGTPPLLRGDHERARAGCARGTRSVSSVQTRRLPRPCSPTSSRSAAIPSPDR